MPVSVSFYDPVMVTPGAFWAYLPRLPEYIEIGQLSVFEETEKLFSVSLDSLSADYTLFSAMSGRNVHSIIDARGFGLFVVSEKEIDTSFGHVASSGTFLNILRSMETAGVATDRFSIAYSSIAPDLYTEDFYLDVPTFIFLSKASYSTPLSQDAITTYGLKPRLIELSLDQLAVTQVNPSSVSIDTDVQASTLYKLVDYKNYNLLATIEKDLDSWAESTKNTDDFLVTTASVSLGNLFAYDTNP